MQETKKPDDDVMLTARMKRWLLTWLDDYAAERVAREPGIKFDRTDAVRALLIEGLRAKGIRQPPTK